MLAEVLVVTHVKSGLRPESCLILKRQSRQSILLDYFAVKNGLLSIFTFPDHLLGKAISYHRLVATRWGAVEFVRQ